MKPLVLASASPRRRELLNRLQIPFQVVPSSVQESVPQGGSPEVFVCEAARAKARSLALDFPQSTIIGADTVVCLNDSILGKPKDSEHGASMLRDLSGTIHDVLTGVYVFEAETDREACGWEKTRVFFRTLQEWEIQAYMKTEEPMDKAGAYAIQGIGAVFVEKIEGCYFNVVGLPLFHLHQLLASLGINVLAEEVVHGGKKERSSNP